MDLNNFSQLVQEIKYYKLNFDENNISHYENIIRIIYNVMNADRLELNYKLYSLIELLVGIIDDKILNSRSTISEDDLFNYMIPDSVVNKSIFEDETILKYNNKLERFRK